MRRLIRIYPPYWFALAPVAIGFVVTAGHLMRGHLGIPMNLFADLTLFPQRAPTLGVSWTLSYEMLFYIVFALIVFLPPSRIIPALAVWALAQCALYVAFHESRQVFPAFVGSVLPLEFIAGAGIGLIHVKGRMPFAWVAAGAAVAATVLLWLAFATLGDPLGTGSQALRTLEILVPSALLVYAAVALETTKAVRAPAWLVLIGNASYALYLWHITILFALGHVLQRFHPRGYPAHVLLLTAMIALTIGLSIAIYELFEKPVTAALNRALLRPKTKNVVVGEGRPLTLGQTSDSA